MKKKLSFLLLPLLSVVSTPLAGQDAPDLAAGAPAAGAPAAGAPAANFVPGRAIEMSPEQKRPLLLKADERNPYARRSPRQEDLNENGDNAEELEIRERLSSLSVSGRSNGKNGLRVLLGDIIVEQGRILPKLLLDQSEDLQVIEVSEDTLVLGWLDIETGELTGKTMQMAYDLSPRISYALHGQERVINEDGSAAMAERQMGVLYIGQERKKQQREMAATDPARKLPREVTEAGQ